ncbi:MAG: right-handed parallel beta-helix repeat-containing protein [Fuerstiella sp.]|jgi:parallel beta-helix repeat protein|nr:right-handed parallel beta-helix repeat-containing protein [Fuerstiella sp.]MDG2127353.1 right-handed parallel beta-helix repeat-containing protein [Fuerstiella sp.]
MKTTLSLSVLLCVPQLILAADPLLPGARPVIDASQFASLQAAFDAVPEGGGLLRLPAGDFEITEPLLLQRGDVRVEGAGSATNLINRNEDSKPALIVQHPDGQKVNKDDRLWRVNLSNFRITGNARSGHGIEAILIEEIFVQGVSVSYCGGDGIRLDHCYEDPRVSDCLITYNKAVGLNLLGCHDIVVSSNQFEENQDALHCIDSFNICMTGNCVDDHLGKGVLIENTYGSVLSGNMIEECRGTAVTLDRDCYGITISANVIAHNGEGVDLVDAHGCAVSANTFTLMKNHALRIGEHSGRIAVTGNSFCNSYLGDGKIKRKEGDRLAGGLVLHSTSHISVTGNVFSGLSTAAVAIEGETAEITSSANVTVERAKE